MPFTNQDKAHLTTLRQSLPQKPLKGHANSYTAAAGGWSPPLAANMLVSIETSLSGVSVGRLPEWAVDVTEVGARSDAEVHLVLAYDDHFYQQTRGSKLPAGTLYIHVDKGPCRSCRRTLRALQKYWKCRMVVSYSGEKIVSGGHVGDKGFADAVSLPGTGHYVLFERDG